MRRVITVVLSVAGLAAFSAPAYADPPNPDPNHHAVDAVCGHVPDQARVPFCD
jgi:hypothetical protein